MIKILILIAFGLIIYNMGKALFNLVSSKGSSKNLLKALALRVLSVSYTHLTLPTTCSV